MAYNVLVKLIKTKSFETTTKNIKFTVLTKDIYAYLQKENIYNIKKP